MRISTEMEQAVCEAYAAGEKVSSISERLGVPHATVYWLLNRHGVTPSRQKRGVRLAASAEEVSGYLDTILEQEELIEALEAEIQDLRKRLGRKR